MNSQNYRRLLAEITKLFFRSKEFKIFDVDKKGWFISLGLTTSIETMEKLKNVIKNSDYGFNSSLRVLQSKKIEEDEMTNYENLILEDEPFEKFLSDPPKEDYTIYGKEDKDKFPELAKSIESLVNSWEDHGILVHKEADPVVYYKKVNYKKMDNNVELRLGIYVELVSENPS